MSSTGTYYTNLADVARRTGYKVVEVSGWKTRGHGGLEKITGVVNHHTGTSAPGDFPSLRVVTYGRSNLPGPLCNFGLGRSGTIYVVAAGRAYHAGVVKDQRWSNEHSLGIEAENNGVGERWSPQMIDSYMRLNSEINKEFGLSAALDQGHKEICYPAGRKIDPAGINMDDFRQGVVRVTHEEELDMATLQEIHDDLQGFWKDYVAFRDRTDAEVKRQNEVVWPMAYAIYHAIQPGDPDSTLQKDYRNVMDAVAELKSKMDGIAEANSEVSTVTVDVATLAKALAPAVSALLKEDLAKASADEVGKRLTNG